VHTRIVIRIIIRYLIYTLLIVIIKKCTLCKYVVVHITPEIREITIVKWSSEEQS